MPFCEVLTKSEFVCRALARRCKIAVSRPNDSEARQRSCRRVVVPKINRGDRRRKLYTLVYIFI